MSPLRALEAYAYSLTPLQKTAAHDPVSLCIELADGEWHGVCVVRLTRTTGGLTQTCITAMTEHADSYEHACETLKLKLMWAVGTAA